MVKITSTSLFITYVKVIISMTTIHEIQQTMWVHTPKGLGQPLFIIDYGIHQNTIWVVCLKESGNILHFDSKQLKIERNNTLEINLLDNKS